MSSKVLEFVFPYSKSRMVNIWRFNDLSKNESKILSFKQDTDFEYSLLCKQSLRLVIVHLCAILVRLNQMVLFCLFILFIFHEHIKSINLVWNELFCQRKA